MDSTDFFDPITWYTDRCLDYKPRHFVVSKTPVTKESHIWIQNKLSGRFALLLNIDFNTGIYTSQGNLIPAFEDPAEAVLYELTWS